MKAWKKYAAFFILLATGCAGPHMTASRDAGKFVSADKMPSSWNEPTIVKITTTKGTFMVMNRTVSAMVGAQCEVEGFSDGTGWLFIGDNPGVQIGGPLRGR